MGPGDPAEDPREQSLLHRAFSPGRSSDLSRKMGASDREAQRTGREIQLQSRGESSAGESKCVRKDHGEEAWRVQGLDEAQ